MLKEKTNLIIEDFKKRELGSNAIALCIEISYALGVNKNIEKINNIILKYSIDGLYTFSTFVLFIYDEYINCKYCDLYTMLEEEINELTEKFIKKYFEEKAKDMDL